MKKLVLLFLILFSASHASLLYKLDDGVALYNSSNYSAAIEYFKNYINSNPNDEDGYFWLARSYSAKNDSLQAIIAFKKAYNIASNDKNIDKIDFENNKYNNLEDYFDMAANYFEQGDFKEALNYADMMLKIDPDCASAYFIKAKIAYIEEDKTSAQEFLNKAILLNNSLLKTKLAKKVGINKIPDLSQQDYILYAQKAYFKGDINSSIKYLKKYIELDNKNVDVYLMLINCYLKNKNITEAENALSDAQKIADNNPALILAQADIAYSKHSEKYEDILLKAYNINPNNKNTLLKLGNFYLDNKNYIQARKYFETLVSVDDKLYEGYFGYVYSLIKTDDIKKAQDMIRSASSVASGNGEINYLLSLICEASGEYKDALDYIQNALKKEKHLFYYVQAGKLSYILGNYETSIQYLTPAINNQTAQEYLMLNYIKLNNTQKVNELISSSSILDKNRIIYKYYLYKTYKLENNIELKTILKQKPSKIQDYIDLARINALEGKEEHAKKILNNALKKFNNSAEVKYAMQEILYKK